MRWSSVVVFAFALTGCAVVSSNLRPTSGPSSPQKWSELTDLRIKESSGIAESPTKTGLFYTHNDSGSPAILYRFDPASKEVVEIEVNGAKNVDWEDIAAANLDGVPYLFVGDVGDNQGRRSTITVYRVPEPGEGATSIEPDQTYRLRYPDEPHNCETLMVHPQTGDLYVVTKASKRPSMVFKLDRPRESGSFTLRKIGEFRLGGDIRESRLVTGGAISPDGERVLLRTYMGAYEFDAPTVFDDWVKVEPRPVKTNLDGQGEAITYARDGRMAITTSEGVPMLVSRIPLER